MHWRDKIIAAWPDDLQRAAKVRTALADLDRALSELAGMGHPLHVEEGYIAPPPPGWPRAMFHLYAGCKVVHCQADLDELGEDWHPTMEQARHQAGLIKQQQRGGIFSKAMPSLLTQTPDEVRRNQEAAIRAREQQRQNVNDLRLAHRAGFAEQRILIDHGKDQEHEPSIPDAIERLRIRQ